MAKKKLLASPRLSIRIQIRNESYYSECRPDERRVKLPAAGCRSCMQVHGQPPGTSRVRAPVARDAADGLMAHWRGCGMTVRGTDGRWCCHKVMPNTRKARRR